MGDLINARRTYRTLVAVAPMLATPHHDLGVVALKLGHADEAIRELTRATELDPHVAPAWLDLGGALDQAGRFAEARDAFGACLDADTAEERCRTNYSAEVEKLAGSGWK
ncbi:MAG TPA: tetratricopeptide repeat protein [Myxococcaceae bacterium]|nr:tetratricopeptide repeat protein [Myxococcaceae bacterium]